MAALRALIILIELAVSDESLHHKDAHQRRVAGSPPEAESTLPGDDSIQSALERLARLAEVQKIVGRVLFGTNIFTPSMTNRGWMVWERPLFAKLEGDALLKLFADEQLLPSIAKVKEHVINSGGPTNRKADYQATVQFAAVLAPSLRSVANELKSLEDEEAKHDHKDKQRRNGDAHR
jgi:hypothetical protein